jgi:hypothetical protein
MNITIEFSDQSPSRHGLKGVNEQLLMIGVCVGSLPISASVFPILEAAQTRATNPAEQQQLIETFTLSRAQLLESIRLAGRDPVEANGGCMSTAEVGVPPYPKVYDMQAMNEAAHNAAEQKFGRLHVNKSEHGGVDEYMALVSGGPWTWFFAFSNHNVAKLSLSAIPAPKASKSEIEGWSISYPGLGPHGAFMDPERGLCIASICGPATWNMCYEAPGLALNPVLGTNPWVDFRSDKPRLMSSNGL